MDNYRIVETVTENQVSDLMDLYKNEFWCDKRRREDVVKMLAAIAKFSSFKPQVFL
ncbi:hypothetical protein [Microcoleus sp.]|uniref:hypothetical protein n=1 Tax=Microcoleus sp. TaxID=44472 RepID=UPI0035938D24